MPISMAKNSEELKNIIENRQMSLEELNRAINIVKIPTVLILQDVYCYRIF